MDIVDSATRSRMMSGIRGVNTKPELQVRSALHRLGYRFRLHVRDLPGKPDIVLPRHRAVVMVHGCFWHGHDCSLFKLPKTRTEFWCDKIARNKAIDVSSAEALRGAGWRLATVWECALKGRGRLSAERVSSMLDAWLHSTDNVLELRGTNGGEE